MSIKATPKNGNLKGALLVVRYSGGKDIIALLPDGPNGDIGTSKLGISGFTGFDDPLDLIEDVNTGNIYVSEYGGNKITLLRPSNQASPKPVIALSTEEIVSDDISGGAAGPANTILVSNLGTAPLQNVSITLSGANANQFIVNSSTLPTINPGETQSFTVAFNPASNGPKVAQVSITGTNADAKTVTLRGLGKTGLGGANEPSLQWILDTYGIAVNIGDDNPATNIIHSQSAQQQAAILGDEVSIQQFQRAIDAPVILELLSVYGPTANNPIVAFGWYESGNTNALNELFTVSNSPTSNGQTLNAPINGVLEFDPGLKSFGFYNRWPFFQDRHLYSEDALNIFSGAIPHHIRVYPLPGEANAYIIATEEHISGFDYQDIVVIARNVKPAETTPPIADLIQINFSDEATNAPAGYLKDFGQAFGDRGEYDYGWVATNGTTPLNLVGNGRNRTPASPDVLTQTLMHMQYNNVTNPNNGIPTEGFWEIALPNGSYEVTVGAGDANNENQAGTNYVINAEGVQLISNLATQGVANFFTGTQTVVVMMED
ncbi:MAG: choice-of-anchor D domain-containing protein [Bacteroidia bacterium]|nr:choice-of-anchor D domain-containing protein [Bacteroidia bacterium]